MERLTGKDAIFLYMDTPTRPMHMGFAGVFDPSTIPGGITEPRAIYDRVVSLLEGRLHLFPPLRQRVVEMPFRIHHPLLVDDPDFDLAFHVRRTALPAPGGRRELEDFVSEALSRPLDRGRPLWEMYVVEGLEGGEWALVVKAHHVMIDGVGGNEILVNLLDLEPEPRTVEPPEQEWEPEQVPRDARLLVGALGANLVQPPRMIGAVRRSAGTVASVVRSRLSEKESSFKLLGPRTLLNSTASSHRRVAFCRVPFPAVRAVKDAFGVKVNDVVLGLCGRALRRFLARLGDEPASELIAAVPISVRVGEVEGGGNRVAGTTVALADDREDPVEQLHRIHTTSLLARERLGAITADILADWTQFATPALAAQAFRFYAGFHLARRHPPVANLTISNIPGPNLPLYVAGSEMRSMYPIGPVVEGQALNITVATYRDTMFVGVVADRDVIADLAPLVAELESAMDDFVAAAEDADERVDGNDSHD